MYYNYDDEDYYITTFQTRFGSPFLKHPSTRVKNDNIPN